MAMLRSPLRAKIGSTDADVRDIRDRATLPLETTALHIFDKAPHPLRRIVNAGHDVPAIHDQGHVT